MIVVDTTVLVYAVGDDHPLRAPCRRLIEAVADGTVTATTTPEVLQEFVHVRARRRGRPDAVGLARAYATLFAPLTEVSADDLDHGLELFASHEELGAFDAVLAACALRIGARALVSADRAFGALSRPEVLDPGAAGFTETLGG